MINNLYCFKGGIVIVQKKSQMFYPKSGLIISQIMIIVFLVGNIYLFINQESIVAKSLTVVSFIIFLFLLIVSFIAFYKLKMLTALKKK